MHTIYNLFIFLIQFFFTYLRKKNLYYFIGVAFGRETTSCFSRGLREDLVHPKHSWAHRDILVTAVHFKIMRSVVSPLGRLVSKRANLGLNRAITGLGSCGWRIHGRTSPLVLSLHLTSVKIYQICKGFMTSAANGSLTLKRQLSQRSLRIIGFL